MINPYENIDFNNSFKILSTSHVHCVSQEKFDLLYQSGLEHFALSNYYPSKPYYPLTEYFTVPSDVIDTPNAEHHDMFIDGVRIGSLHVNSLGSTFVSNPDGVKGQGVLEDWKTAFDKMLEQLLYEDGGGITINHPTWSNTFGHININNFVYDLLDYDHRVLGIEIFNESCNTNEARPNTGWALDLWDRILNTGRKCWGFAVPDHAVNGRNVLLTRSRDEHTCLKAYRDGAFYCKIGQSDLEFTNIKLVDNVLNVETNNATSICVVINGSKSTHNGSFCSVNIPQSARYVRVEAHTSDDSLFSNPVILKEYDPANIRRRNKLIWY